MDETILSTKHVFCCSTHTFFFNLPEWYFVKIMNIVARAIAGILLKFPPLVHIYFIVCIFLYVDAGSFLSLYIHKLILSLY